MSQVMEPSPPVIAKKLWNTVRIVFFMLRKGISKSKLMVDLNYMLKRGNKIAEKAIDNLILNHNHLTCRPDDADLSFFSPREYEFSCSNSPAAGSSHFPASSHYKRKHHYHYRHGHYRSHHHYDGHDMNAVNAVQKVLDMLNKNSNETTRAPEAASPLTTLPGFGRSPVVRQLRITDSPFPVKDSEEDTTQVDKAAEDFIEKFYKELKQQKKKAAIESPYHDMWFG